jgi:hypothetical protein
MKILRVEGFSLEGLASNSVHAIPVSEIAGVEFISVNTEKRYDIGLLVNGEHLLKSFRREKVALDYFDKIVNVISDSTPLYMV